ncbi:MAG: hypothetical protein R2873_22835 [Caldilineaceae bacterium]
MNSPSAEADNLAAMMWDVRDQLIPQIPNAARSGKDGDGSAETPVSPLRARRQHRRRQLSDTTILAELVRQEATGGGGLRSRVGATVAAAGIGGDVDLMVGGKTDDEHGAPVAIRESSHPQRWQLPGPAPSWRAFH